MGLMACATTSATPNVVEPSASLAPPDGEAFSAEEAAQIEAAKRHPIALTYERPRDPAALPVAPPKIPAEPLAAAPAPPTRAPDQVIIVGQDRPEATPSAPASSYELSGDPTAYPVAPGSVTYESYPEPVDSGYVWVDGAWVASTPVSPNAQWGVYVGSPGWSRRYPRSWAPYPPVVVVPGGHRHYGHPHYVAPPRHRHWHSDPHPRYRPEPRGLRGSERRRDVYVAPSVRPSRAPAAVAPVRAPAARGRSEARGEIRGGSRGEARRGSGRGSSSGRRSVHVGR
jgi:hypothetical protein